MKRLKYFNLSLCHNHLLTKTNICAKFERNRWFELYHPLPGFLMDTLLKVWVEQREREIQGSNQMVSVIVYEFYAKGIKSKALINARSAMSASVKRTVLSLKRYHVCH